MANSTPRLPRPIRRVQLMEAATAVFADKGYYLTSMDEVADRASVTKPVLYQHFTGKSELFAAVVQSATERVAGKVAEELAGPGQSREKVRNAIFSYFEFATSHREALRLMFEADRLEEDIVPRGTDVKTVLAAEITKAVERESGLGGEEARLAGHAIAGMAENMARTILNEETSPDSMLAADVVFRIAWKGVANFPEKSGGAEDSPQG